jgi:hypothetical protein
LPNKVKNANLAEKRDWNKACGYLYRDHKLKKCSVQKYGDVRKGTFQEAFLTDPKRLKTIKMKTEKTIKRHWRKSRKKAQYLAQKVTTEILMPLANMLNS